MPPIRLLKVRTRRRSFCNNALCSLFNYVANHTQLSQKENDFSQSCTLQEKLIGKNGGVAPFALIKCQNVTAAQRLGIVYADRTLQQRLVVHLSARPKKHSLSAPHVSSVVHNGSAQWRQQSSVVLRPYNH